MIRTSCSHVRDARMVYFQYSTSQIIGICDLNFPESSGSSQTVTSGTHLFVIKEDGTGLQQITFNDNGFDAYDDRRIFFEAEEKISGNGSAYKIKSMRLTHKGIKIIPSDPYRFGTGSCHGIAAMPVLIKNPHYVYAYEPNLPSVQKNSKCAQSTAEHTSLSKKFLNPCTELYKVNQFGQIINPLTNNSVMATNAYGLGSCHSLGAMSVLIHKPHYV
ncbi:hypothetical protein Ddc_10344 [Ditylenchus destructor]|nr:hypothetical protein Ddc_10344 [Ditylenchus destructor]